MTTTFAEVESSEALVWERFCNAPVRMLQELEHTCSCSARSSSCSWWIWSKPVEACWDLWQHKQLNWGYIERGVPEPQKIRLNVWDMPNLFKNDVQEVWMVVSRAKSPYFLASSPRKHCLVRAKRPRPMPKSCKNAVRQTWMPVKCQTGWNQGKLQQILGTSFLVITLVPKQSFDEPLGPWGRFRWRGGALRIICRILRLFRFRFRCSAVIGLYAPKPWLQNA